MGEYVVISGYYGFDNLGDEAILYSIIKLLKSKKSDLKIIVLSQNPEITASRYGVKSIYRYDLVEIIKVLKKSSLFISGGGSLLQDVTGIRSVPYYLGLVFLANIFGNKTVYYAQGIGPLKRKISKNVVKWVSNSVDLITVRDRDSAELLQKIGVNNKLIKETVDPVYALDLFNEKENENNSENISEFINGEKINIEKEKVIALSVRPWGDNSYIKSMAKAADYIKEKTDAKVIILPMYIEDDLQCSKKLKKLMNNEALLIKKQLKPSDMINVYRGIDFFIGVRLHSLIFAAVTNTPFIGISYDPKVDSLLFDLDLETGLSTENIDYNEFKKIIDDFWKNKAIIAEQLRLKINKYSQKAEENVERVLELIV